MMRARELSGSFLLVLLAACSGERTIPTVPDTTTPPAAKSRVASVVASHDSFEMTHPGSARTQVVVRDTLGRTVLVEDTLKVSVTLTGPFAASWESANRLHYRILEITATGPGAGTVVISSDGSADTISLSAQPLSFSTITAGPGWACGLDLEGRAWCWGDNSADQLGFVTVGQCNGTVCQYGGLHRAPTPLPVATTQRFIALAAGGRGICSPTISTLGACGRTCAVNLAGELRCWGSGYNVSESLTIESRLTALAMAEEPYSTNPYTALNCGISDDSIALCFKRTGATTPPTVTRIGGEHTFRSLSVSPTHSCGVTLDGDAYCWGRNDKGYLGIGRSDTMTHATPELVIGGLKFRSVAVGRGASCGITEAGRVYCWGAAYTPAGAFEPAPREVEGGGYYASISLTGNGTRLCALTSDGVVYCWTEYNQPPETIPIPQPLKSISLGADTKYFPAHGCGVSTTNVGWCWNATGSWKVGQ